MKKNIIYFIKRITFSIGVIYGFNIIMQEIGIFIPINIISITIMFFLGIPGFLSIIAIIFIV